MNTHIDAKEQSEMATSAPLARRQHGETTAASAPLARRHNLERLAAGGFTSSAPLARRQEEIVALLWLQQWYQAGGSDRVEVLRHWEFLKHLILTGKLDV